MGEGGSACDCDTADGSGAHTRSPQLSHGLNTSHTPAHLRRYGRKNGSRSHRRTATETTPGRFTRPERYSRGPELIDGAENAETALEPENARGR